MFRATIDATQGWNKGVTADLGRHRADPWPTTFSSGPASLAQSWAANLHTGGGERHSSVIVRSVTNGHLQGNKIKIKCPLLNTSPKGSSFCSFGKLLNEEFMVGRLNIRKITQKYP